MEHNTAIPDINYRTHRQDPATASDGRDPPACPGCGQMHTEHAERYHDHQELCGPRHHSAECSQLQQRTIRSVVGTGRCPDERLTTPPSTNATKCVRQQKPVNSHSIQG